MSQKQSAEFSDSIGWSGWTAIPEDSGQQNTPRDPSTFSAKGLRDLAVCLRLGPRALAFLLGGTFLFIFATCCVAVLLAESHRGADFGYYGYEVLTNTEDLHGR